MVWLQLLPNPPLFTDLPVRQVSAALDVEVAKITGFGSLAIEPLPSTRSVSVKRQAEYLAGRWCALRALRTLNNELGHVDLTTQSPPVWPPRVTGSITHTAGFVAAAVVDTQDLDGLGIDSEAILTPAVVQDIQSLICSPREMDVKPHDLTVAEFMTLVFSAKESVYKCLHPIAQRFIEFTDVQVIAVDCQQRRFRCELQVDLAVELPRGTIIDGRFVRDAKLIHTAAIFTRLKERI